MNTRTIAIALTLILCSGQLFATTARRREPTAGANLIAYQLTVGSTMKRDGDAVELFANDQSRFALFQKAAIETIKRRLREHGIESEADSLETKARAHFAAGFYGHRIEGACVDMYVFYLTARGVERTGDETFEDTWEWSSLNSASGTKLEAALTSELELALDDYLADRPLTTPKPPSN